MLFGHLAPRIPNVGHIASGQDSNKGLSEKSPSKTKNKNNKQSQNSNRHFCARNNTAYNLLSTECFSLTHTVLTAFNCASRLCAHPKSAYNCYSQYSVVETTSDSRYLVFSTCMYSAEIFYMYAHFHSTRTRTS